MANDTPFTIAEFLRRQVWRSDFLLIDEAVPERTRFPHEQKLEILHTLCCRNGYRDAGDCERVRRALYTREQHDDCPAALLLSLAYLPDHVCSLPEPVDTSEEARLLARLRRAQPVRQHPKRYRLSSLSWAERRFWLNLPEDIHALLIERDCALLAA